QQRAHWTLSASNQHCRESERLRFDCGGVQSWRRRHGGHCGRADANSRSAAARATRGKPRRDCALRSRTHSQRLAQIFLGPCPASACRCAAKSRLVQRQSRPYPLTLSRAFHSRMVYRHSLHLMSPAKKPPEFCIPREGRLSHCKAATLDQQQQCKELQVMTGTHFPMLKDMQRLLCDKRELQKGRFISTIVKFVVVANACFRRCSRPALL